LQTPKLIKFFIFQKIFERFNYYDEATIFRYYYVAMY